KGGTGTDSFTLAAGKSITGKIDGGAGPGLNALDYSAFATAVTVNLQTRKATGMGGFSNIGHFLARSDLKHFLTAANLSNAWDLTSTNAGSITNSAGAFTFTGFENLAGGSLDDTLNKNGNLLTGHTSKIETVNP